MRAIADAVLLRGCRRAGCGKETGRGAEENCDQGGQGTRADRAVLVWRGDHNVARAFMKDWAADYEKTGQGRFTLQPFSTISGLDAVSAGTADIAGSSRPPMPGRVEEQTTNFPRSRGTAWS
jgi:ABC-type phosphate transport system substrate-binding protein